MSSRQPERVLDGFPLPEGNTKQSSHDDSLPVRDTEQSSHEDLPFSLDDDPSGPLSSPSFQRKSIVDSKHGYSRDPKPDCRDISNLSNRTDSSKYIRAPGDSLKESRKTMGLGSQLDNRPKRGYYIDYLLYSSTAQEYQHTTHLSWRHFTYE